MPRSRSPLDRVFGAIVPRAVDAMDPDGVLERVDLDTLLDRLDVEAVIERIDVDALVQRVDVDALVQRVDVDALVQRVDVDALVQRVDVDALVARVDLDTVLSRVDVRALAARAGIDQIVAEATTGLAARALNTARRQVLALDRVVLGLVDRLMGRVESGSPVPRRPPAGPFARVLAFAADSAVVSASFAIGVTVAGYLFRLFTGRDFDPAESGGPGWAVAYAVWWFLYLWVGIGVSGRTVGKGLVGLRVMAVDGSEAGARRAATRTVAFPFSFVLGLGFVPAVVGRQRRAVHDHLSGTVEVVDWGRGRAASVARSTDPRGVDAP